MWMLPLYLHVNQKSDYDDMMMFLDRLWLLKLLYYILNREIKEPHKGILNSSTRASPYISLTRSLIADSIYFIYEYLNIRTDMPKKWLRP